MEFQLNELGYDVFTQPAVHLSERRRLLEGQRVKTDIEREQRRDGGAQQRDQSKAAYRDHFYGGDSAPAEG